MKILINASNLQGGGSIQVASSIIYELMNDSKFLNQHSITLYVNEKIILNIECEIKCNYQVLNWTPISLFNPMYFFKFKGFDVVFNVFGPVYSVFKNKNTLTGFALPYLFEKKLSFKSIIRKYFFFKSENLIIEHHWLGDKVRQLFPKNEIFVVYNALNNVFYTNENTSFHNKLFFDLKSQGYKFFYCITRNYPHKNIERLLKLIKSLNVNGKYGLVLSLKPDETTSLNLDEKYIVNLGELNIKNIPSVIDNCDFFISLSEKECFSISPLEALKMGKKIFLNDRDFYRHTIGSYATYIDSNDLIQSEKKIKNTLDEKNLNSEDFLKQFHPKIRWENIKKLIENYE
tara:strand:- start:386 stop:1420 length:1035 start_codon:yes stop_codon:yes gene_type:complete